MTLVRIAGSNRHGPDLRRRMAWLGGAALLVLGTALPAAAGPAAAGPVGARRVSGPTPFSGCPATGGTFFPDAEVEPYITADPTHPGHLVGIWQQDRYTDGGARGLVAATSTDNGRTWTRSLLPFNRCAPGGLHYQRASDPWVSVGPDGTVYASGLSFDFNGAPPIDGAPNAIGTATSSDGGRTWQHVRAVGVDSGHGGRSYTDKDSIAADPNRAGTAYLVWDRLFAASATSAARVRGPAFFAETTDGGRTWSRPKIIVVPKANHVLFANTIVVDPRSGRLYDVFEDQTPGRVPRLEVVTSTDAGATWTAPVQVAWYDAVFIQDPNNANMYAGGSIYVPSVAIDPTTGRLYVAFDSGRFNGYNYGEVALTSSIDGGRTWTKAVRANTHTGRPAFMPAIAVNGKGILGVSYYDLRSLAPSNTTTLPTDRWLRSSANAGRTFGPDQHLAGPFNYAAAPNLSGSSAYGVYFLGDYQGLAASGGGFTGFFAAGNCLGQCPANPSDIYAAWASPLLAPASAATSAGSTTSGIPTPVPPPLRAPLR